MDYIAVVHKDPDSDYGVSFPDFPGCVSAGATLDKAKDMAAEALAIALDMRREDGEPAPPSSSLDTIISNPDFQDGIAFLVINAEPNRNRTVRVNITMSARDLHAIDANAQASGLSRSAFLVRAALDVVGKDRLLHTITSVKPLGAGRVQLNFDGETDQPVIDLSPMLAQGGVFTPLRDPKLFSTAEVGSRGRTLLWRLPAGAPTDQVRGLPAAEIVALRADALWLMAHPQHATDRSETPGR